jgi:hypothetical protein
MTQRTDRTGKARIETDAPNGKKATVLPVPIALKIGFKRALELDQRARAASREWEAIPEGEQ